MNRTVTELLRDNAGHAREFASRFDGVQDGQRPDAVTVCCSDSRVLQDRMWGNETPGRLFTCGNIGNRVIQRTDDGEVVSGDVLYPLEHTGTRTAVVVGHTGCGAVTAAYGSITGEVDVAAEPPGIRRCIDLIAPHLEPGVERLPAGLTREDAVNRLVEYNVDRQVEALLDSDDVPADTDVVGAVYDFQDVYDGERGEVHVVNVGGVRDPETLRESHAGVADRIDRRWTY